MQAGAQLKKSRIKLDSKGCLIILYYIILHCIISYHIISSYIIYITLYYIISYNISYIILYYITLYHITPYHIIIYHIYYIILYYVKTKVLIFYCTVRSTLFSFFLRVNLKKKKLNWIQGNSDLRKIRSTQNSAVGNRYVSPGMAVFLLSKKSPWRWPHDWPKHVTGNTTNTIKLHTLS